MARKRKATGRRNARNEVKPLGPADAKLRINTWEDVADSEDEFHINRDKILLDDGPAPKKRRRLQDEGKMGPSGVALPESRRLILCR
jgi:U3 small nucleolar RNA-associated protein 3